MEEIIEQTKHITSINDAKILLKSITQITPQIQKALDYAVLHHEGQYRKSGEAYAIHPILVASLVAYLGGDEDMIISSILHDVVEDTSSSPEEVKAEFGSGVEELVDGLTKIVEIRQDKLAPSSSNEKLIKSALSFHKMLIASIKDARVLVIKLCDRLHNMLTISALRVDKQKRIAEETLLVYAPIAHRLGISFVKNLLEDLSFKIVLPNEYNKIEKYFNENRSQLQLRLNHFVDKVKIFMLKNGFSEDSFEIQKRIKHGYSIYLKMQRKGISIEEVLDLVAIRILVKESLDCYKALGILHLHFNPLIARFKDYVAIPKENGYQTIHSTIFDDSAIIEAQIRTFDMHKTAEFGVAAHWKYKSSGKIPSLNWLNSLTPENIKKDEDIEQNIEEFYEYAKGNLYSEEVAVFSPKGDLFTLSRGAIVLDFAYEVHSEVGLKAKEAYVNSSKVPLVTELKNGDVVQIITGEEEKPRCSWINMVKTPKAKSIIKQNCRQKIREINIQIAKNILMTVFNIRQRKLLYWLEVAKFTKKLSMAAYDLVYLQDIVNTLKKFPKADKLLFPLLKIDRYRLRCQNFNDIIIHANHKIDNIEFDYCCHPKRNDAIMGIKQGSNVVVHHKLCHKADKLVNDNAEMVFVSWSLDSFHRYKLIACIENKRGSLATFLFYLGRLELDIIQIKLNNSDDSEIDYFELIVELSDKHSPSQIEKQIKDRYKIIQFISLDDAYKE